MRYAVILGAGITGLRCAQLLQREYNAHILEKRPSVGGLAASFSRSGYTLDLGPHKLYSQLPGVMEQYPAILRGKVRTVEKRNSLRLFGRDFSFPAKPMQLALQFPKIPMLRMGVSYLAAQTKYAFRGAPSASYEEYFVHRFGTYGYRHLFRDLCLKIWGDPREISSELAERRIPVPSLAGLVLSTLSRAKREKVSASRFYYPLEGGVGTLCTNLQYDIERSGGVIEVNAVPSRVRRNGNGWEVLYVRGGKDRRAKADVLVSTIHLRDLVDLFEDVPEDVRNAASKLRYRSLLVCYLLLDTSSVLHDQWIFYPEGKYLFSRVSELKNFGVQTCPKGKTVLMAEVGCAFEDEIYNLPQEQLKARVLADLAAAGIPAKEHLAEFFVVRINRMYPVYNVGFRKHLGVVLDWIDSLGNVYTIGRQGLFNYSNTDHSLDMANRCAEHILSGEDRSGWERSRLAFDAYRIVD